MLLHPAGSDRIAALERPVAFPLRRKLGLLSVGLVALLAAVCGVGIHQLVAIRKDAKRLLEESRELALANDLDAHFESIGILMQLVDSAGESDMTRDYLVMQIEDVREILRAMDAGPAGAQDPSRAQHQAEELAMTGALDRRLAALEQRLINRTGDIPDEDHAAVGAMRAQGTALEEEALEEAELAERDLAHRSRSAVKVMLGTVAVAGLGLLATLAFVLRTVVRPLRLLKLRADAVGQGDLAPRTDATGAGGDEIADLARAFEEMAHKVAAARVALEHRVATKERELARAARYADLGVLSAGVAHEINNPLATIATCAEGLLRRIERNGLEPGQAAEYFRTIVSEAYRARDITQRLLTLARPDPAPVERVELTGLLAELARVTKHQLERRGITLEIDAPAPLAVRGSSGELLQALVNLVLNARDASPTGRPVRITAARQDATAVLDVDDEGAGVPPELVERIFEPFFTTKPPGEGTGLGLSLVASIVEGHGGSVSVMRSPRGGARFRVRIPLDVAPPAEEIA
jgi:signal transduction histidine kinase